MVKRRIHIGYFYNGKMGTESTLVDSERDIPREGTIIERHGEQWIVHSAKRLIEGGSYAFFIVHLETKDSR